jgi:hypothetical protein
VAVGSGVWTRHGTFRSRGLHQCRENGRLRRPAGASLWLSEVRQENEFSQRAVYLTYQTDCQQCTLRERCLASGAKGDRARRVSAVRRLLPPPAVIERKPIILGSMRLSSMWPVERFAVPGSPTGVGNMWRSFPWLGSNWRLNLLLVLPVPSVRIIVGVGMIGCSVMLGRDLRNGASVSLVFLLFSP